MIGLVIVFVVLVLVGAVMFVLCLDAAVARRWLRLAAAAAALVLVASAAGLAMQALSREERRLVEACLASGGFPVESLAGIDCLEGRR